MVAVQAHSQTEKHARVSTRLTCRVLFLWAQLSASCRCVFSGTVLAYRPRPPVASRREHPAARGAGVPVARGDLGRHVPSDPAWLASQQPQPQPQALPQWKQKPQHHLRGRATHWTPTNDQCGAGTIAGVSGSSTRSASSITSSIPSFTAPPSCDRTLVPCTSHNFRPTTRSLTRPLTRAPLRGHAACCAQHTRVDHPGSGWRDIRIPPCARGSGGKCHWPRRGDGLDLRVAWHVLHGPGLAGGSTFRRCAPRRAAHGVGCVVVADVAVLGVGGSGDGVLCAGSGVQSHRSCCPWRVPGVDRPVC